MKKLITDILFQFLKLSNGWPYRKKYSGKVQILMLHRVVSKLGENRIINDGIEVTEDYLDFLISFYIKSGFTPISINDITKALTDKTNKRYVIFTFDDGYLDNYEKALPIFEKYKVPFTIYITLDFINRNQFAWWYFIEDLISENNVLSYYDSGSIKQVVFENHASKLIFFIELREIIQKQPEALSYLINQYKPNLEKYHNLFLNTNQVVELTKHQLVTLGAHSITHASLANLKEELALKEIADSKHELEKIINKPVLHFSYPFGTKKDIGKREINFAKTAGYQTALTTNYGDVQLNNYDLLDLPRIWTANSIVNNELLKIIYGINERSKIKKIN